MLEDSWNRIVVKHAVSNEASIREDMVQEEASSFLDNLEHGSNHWSPSNYQEHEMSSELAANSDGFARHSSTDRNEREAPETAGETIKSPSDETEEVRTKGGSGKGTESPWPERDAKPGLASQKSGRAGHFRLSSFRSDEEYPVFVLDFKLKIKLLPNYRLAPPEGRGTLLPGPAEPVHTPGFSLHWRNCRADPSDTELHMHSRPSWPGPQTAAPLRTRHAAAAPIPWPHLWTHQPEVSGGFDRPQASFDPRLAGSGPALFTAAAPRGSVFPPQHPGARRFAPAC